MGAVTGAATGAAGAATGAEAGAALATVTFARAGEAASLRIALVTSLRMNRTPSGSDANSWARGARAIGCGSASLSRLEASKSIAAVTSTPSATRLEERMTASSPKRSRIARIAWRMSRAVCRTIFIVALQKDFSDPPHSPGGLCGCRGFHSRRARAGSARSSA